MEYRKLNTENNLTLVDMTLYLQDVKVLYNACVDINKQFPEMVGYIKLAEKLQIIIDEKEQNYTDADLID
jgi:hypothetical protein